MGMWGSLLFSYDWSRERVWDSFLWWGGGGIFGWTFLFLFLEGFFSWGARAFFFPFLLPFFCSWGSRSARPWGWLASVFFFSITLRFTVGHTGLCTFRL